jgi:alanine-glyoxylate transaminase / (R)-3-amino-2-methylpropionate-pyruvate transaminase
VIDEENLQRNALEVGTHLLKGFESLRDKYGDIIGDVRGKVR